MEILDPDINNSNSQFDVCKTEPQNGNHIVLYSVGHEAVMRTICNAKEEVPFKHTLKLAGLKWEIVRVSALFDGAAMVVAMCQSVFEKIKHRWVGEIKKAATNGKWGLGSIASSLEGSDAVGRYRS